MEKSINSLFQVTLEYLWRKSYRTFFCFKMFNENGKIYQFIVSGNFRILMEKIL